MKNPASAIRTKWQRLRTKYNDSPHHSFRKTPRVHSRGIIASTVKEAWVLIIESLTFLKRYWRFFLWLILLYALFTYFLVGGVAQADYDALKSSATDVADGLDFVTKAGAYFAAALTGGLTVAPNDVQRLLSGIIALLFWLVTIWAVRMLSAGKQIRLRDAFYNGPTPFITSIIVLLCVALQLAPAAIGLFAMTITVTQNWIETAVEGLAFGGAALLLCLLSLYWLTGSIVAAAVVAIPGMYPLQALADARTLAMGKRWTIALRLCSVLLIQLLIWGAILLPIFMLDNWLDLSWLPLVPVAVQVLSGFSIIFTSIYIYKLYRSLL